MVSCRLVPFKCLQFGFGLDQFLDTVVHDLDGVELGQAETSNVGNVVHAALGLAVFAVDACNNHTHYSP